MENLPLDMKNLWPRHVDFAYLSRQYGNKLNRFLVRVLIHLPWQFSVIKENMALIVSLPYPREVLNWGLSNLYNDTSVFIFVFFVFNIT